MSAPKTQKDKIHLLVLRDSRHPTLIEVADITRESFESGAIVYGSQSSSGDFNPYHIVYKDLLQHYQVLKFTQLCVTVIAGFSERELASSLALRLSLEDMAIANSALKLLGAESMSLKCLICRLP